MTKLTTMQLATLTQIHITGASKGTTSKTRMAIMLMTEMQSDVGVLNYAITDEALELIKPTKMFKLYENLTSKGLTVRKDEFGYSRHVKSFIPFVDENGQTKAWISHIKGQFHAYEYKSGSHEATVVEL